MPARNIHHDAVVHALTADGWTITHDPFPLSYGGRDMYVDLGAERGTIAAEKGAEKIVVEIQSFLNPSPVRDLQEAVGQYDVYRAVLAEAYPDRTLYLAVPRRVAETILDEKFGRLILTTLRIRVVVFDDVQEKVIRWIN